MARGPTLGWRQPEVRRTLPMRPVITIAALALALGAAGAAFSQPEGGQGQGPGQGGGRGGAMRAACQADMQKFCADVQPGQRGARMQCMQAHQNELSDQCKAAMAQMRTMMQQRNGGAPPASSSAPPPGQ